MFRTTLNPHYWYVIRWVSDRGTKMSDGCHGLSTALSKACTAIDDQGARLVQIFDGKEDNAKLVAIIDVRYR